MKLSSVLRLPALIAAALLAPAFVEAEHTSNWAVLVCTSRFWFNYRHLANVLSIYRTVKRLGIPDSQIILMLPDDMACNPRNAFPGTVYSNADRAVDLYGDNIEVDYRGYEVTVENFIRLLTDRVGEEMPRSKRLLTDDRSNILVYMTGHGGNEFLKFQDAEEIGAFDLANAFEEMWEKKRYHEILFMIDTCQANTMYSKLYSPNIIATGSSELDQSSYSHHADNDIGVAVIDRYTYYNLEFLESEVRDTSSKKTIGDLFDSYTYEKIHSHAGVRYDLFRGGAEAARSRLLTDFFGNVQNVEVDGNKSTILEEDILALSKTIAALHQKAEEEEAAGRKNATAKAAEKTAARKVQLAKPLTDDNWWTKKLFGATTLAGCALLWGIGDGDLAVTADDSVHVLVPEFPDLSKRRRASRRDANPSTTQIRTEIQDEESSSDEDDDEYRPWNLQTCRAQYSEGSKHMPVSYPPIDPRINRELFTAIGKPFPYESTALEDSGESDGDIGESIASDDEREDAADDDEDDDDEDEDDDDEDSEDDYSDDDSEVGGPAGIGAKLGSNQPYGAGHGPITSVGSSMNHVVGIGWSPSGLGINRRPILAILTGAGMLCMYGDQNMADNILPRANERMLQRRELSSWMVLWGIGERMVIPGQQTAEAEYVRSFAWAREIAPGQALLATLNDEREVAIISIQTVFMVEEKNSKEVFSFKPSESKESTKWLVREVARFKAEGPHFPISKMDPDFVPCGTSFGLRFGPWLAQDGTRTCVLSFMDRNYIGFRRLTIKDPWVRGEIPNLDIGSNDLYGKCLHLTTDGCVEFENGLWSKDGITTCRGMLSTGWHLEPFEVALAGVPPPPPLAHHHTNDCGTTYDLNHSENPISDFILHPPNPANPTPIPLYTVIRTSATASTPDWYQTNLPLEDHTDEPLWARTIRSKLDITVPVDVFLKRGHIDGDLDTDADDDSDHGDDSDDMIDSDDDSNAHLTPMAMQEVFGSYDAHDDDDENGLLRDANDRADAVPEIHPHRFRLHGITLSPGGGCSAVLISSHSTMHPERGGWHTVRSSVLFSPKPRIPRQQHNTGTDAAENTLRASALTTEGKLFEYLYGGGPEVAGVHYSLTDPQDHLKELFAPALAMQECELCHTKINRTKGDGENHLVGCEKGHFFGMCATSGLAVQIPGVTRCCGTCGLKTMRAEYLLARCPEEIKEEVRRVIGDGVCGGCGGKFLN
ncbi:gpi-anchor transamidase [Podospora australis]|uniref:Gpi-anchor transamidase n=1 Tax=Podospora australis TaxID=1536484 RepID=A0AAN6WWF0_9PEZI|nr:gpi-anchor transamidase [Podospora australis]